MIKFYNNPSKDKIIIKKTKELHQIYRLLFYKPHNSQKVNYKNHGKVNSYSIIIPKLLNKIKQTFLLLKKLILITLKYQYFKTIITILNLIKINLYQNNYDYFIIFLYILFIFVSFFIILK